jgi:hypothetical protein
MQDGAPKHMTVRDFYNFPRLVRAKLWKARILGGGMRLAKGNTHVQLRKALALSFSIAFTRACPFLLAEVSAPSTSM